MRPLTIRVADGFWNIRGSFKIGGVLDVGTQTSLVRRKNGKLLVLHRSSKTIHVDDTLMYFRLPRLLRVLGHTDALSFHPTLAKALERRNGAARGFREWAEALVERWSEAENLCAAHNGALIAKRIQGASIAARIRTALDRAGRTIAAHERKYG